MDFLGVGPLEFLLVLIIALLVVGPERLPEIAQSIGKAVRDLREMSQSITSEWQRELSKASGVEIGEEGLQESLTRPFVELQESLTGSVEGLEESITKPVEEASESVGKSLKESHEDIQKAFTGPSTSAAEAHFQPDTSSSSGTQANADHDNS